MLQDSLALPENSQQVLEVKDILFQVHVRTVGGGGDMIASNPSHDITLMLHIS